MGNASFFRRIADFSSSNLMAEQTVANERDRTHPQQNEVSMDPCAS